ncbi:MAG: anhydro-N-acetylmuramic acid kinase [Anaerolineae bacterium]
MLIIGLMSGTSADGVDVALCQIEDSEHGLQAEIIAGATYAYNAPLRQRILASCDPSQSRVDHIARLHVELAQASVEAIRALIQSTHYTLSDVDLIGSHGQTLWHDVGADGAVYATFQIGEAALIAEQTGITTLSNFRARDVAAGGQGAPLTAYVDWLLLRHPSQWRAVQNIGGMGNVTFLPPREAQDAQAVAFDTGPGNALIDVAVAHFSDGHAHYDRDGQRALQGTVDETWLEALCQHPYYQRPYPKTTGRELFGSETAQAYIAEGIARGLAGDDIIATLTALTARTIAGAYAQFAPSPITAMIVGGGGQHNPTLMRWLSERVAPTQVIPHEAIGLSSDFKEALVFAVLAHETWYGRIGTLPELTGARHATVLGQITPGTNYEHLLAGRDSHISS